MTPETGPLGVRVRERKPTERHLESLITLYREVYLELARKATDAAIDVLRNPGVGGVRIAEAREAYLRELLPILDRLEAIVADAVRLGAARRWHPRERGDDIERLVAVIVHRVRAKRLYWLRKMANDFVRTIILPALAPDDSRAPNRDSEGMASGGGGYQAQLPSGNEEPDFSELFTVGAPEKVYEFTQEKLDELTEKGYRFDKVRAIEATEYDVWSGDDLAYVQASIEDGVQEFDWRTSDDMLVCPICDELDAMIVGQSEALHIAVERPDWSHCRCRCWLEAVEPVLKHMSPRSTRPTRNPLR